jgi:LPXTG-motif cell wall-anchored protein
MMAIAIAICLSILTLIGSNSVFAAPTITKEAGFTGNASIKVTLPAVTDAEKANHTYQIYKIFDATVSTDNQTITYSTTKTTVPAGFEKDSAGNVSYTANKGKSGAQLVTELTADDIAAIKQYVTGNNADLVATVSTTKDDSEFTVTGLPYGYYYITTTTGSIVTVDSTKPNAEVSDKNKLPSIEKEVQEDSKATGTNQEGDGTTGYQKKNDADLGQTVYYKTTVKVQPGAKNYVIHDKMSGLTFVGIDSVKAGSTDITGYTLNTTTTDNCSFELTLPATYLDTVTVADTEVTVLYHATVNQNAIIADVGNPNETWLTYGANGEGESTHKETRTYVWKVDVLKYKNGVDSDTLAGAKFKLSTDSAGTNVMNFSVAATNTWKYDKNGSVTEFTTDATGVLNFEGLDEGVYYLTETEAPAGFNKLTVPIKVTITSNTGTDGNVSTGGTYTVTNKAEEDNATEGTGTIKVNNQQGSVLPSTGGIGTTIFYIIGVVLLAGAAIILVTRRRMNAE